MSGQPPNDFWDRTVPEARFIIRACGRRIEAEHERQRALAHEAAQLTALAFHAPGKIPDYKPIRQPRVSGPTEADDARLRGFFISLALRSKT
jgi:hypothetical protein